MNIRELNESDIDEVARLWHDGWRDAHLAIVPADLTRLRILDSFRERLVKLRATTRVAGDPGAVVGFYSIRGSELYQFYVAPAARGSGGAAALMADAEARMATDGVVTAWLACAVGNDRAARFYEKAGWRRTGVVVEPAETSAGPYPLEVWRYEKMVERSR